MITLSQPRIHQCPCFTDASDYRYFMPVCKEYAAIRFIWAHAGGALQPGQLDPLALIVRYQDRVMTGTGPVWNAHRIYRRYEADEGWDHYGHFLGFHRRWLKQLPATVEEKVRLGNARNFFNRP
ncbi:MAG: hypothetical protein ACE5FQ_08450 [Thiogranum sp.]